MAKKAKGTVEYKETEIFELFPKFLYTALQRKRVVLFHGYTKNYRKLIRYAANFDEENKICLVYLVGEIRQGAIEAELESVGCSDRVCVVAAGFPAFEMKVWSDYDELRKSHKGFGWDAEKDAPSERLLADKRKSYEYYTENMQGSMDGQIGMFGAGEDYDLCERSVREYREFIDTIERYKKLKDKCERVYFKNFRLHRRGHLEKPYTHERLDELIRRIFPQGAEAMGANRYASLSPASIAFAVEWARTGEENRRLGLTVEMTAPAAAAVAAIIRRNIEERGYCEIEEIRGVAASPPYGLGYDGYSAACIAMALRRFRNRTLIFYDGVGHFLLKELAVEMVVDILFGPNGTRRRRRFRDCCLYLESQPHKKVKQFMAKLWGVKIEMPGAAMGLHLGKSLCKTHRIPLSYVDERLLRLTLWNVNFWDKGQVQALADELAAHGDEIMDNYERYKRLNESVPERVMSFINVDYSWVWRAEEYERILWQSEMFGPWPWTNEVLNAAKAEEERRRKGVGAHGGTAL